MPRKICLVRTCRTTSRADTRFFRVPRNEKLRSIWKNILLPHAPQLTDVTENQFRSLYVCEKHFEKKYFSGPSSLYQKRCPTLFTSNEISEEVPSESLFEQYQEKNNNLHSEHSYSLGSIINDHSYAKNWCFVTNQSAKTSISQESSNYSTVQVSTKLSGIVKSDETVEIMPSTSIKRKPRKTKIINSVSKLSPCCKVLYKKCKNVIMKGNKQRGKLIRHVTSTAQTNQMKDALKDVNLATKIFIEMQLRLQGSNKQSRRYKTEEKMLSLAVLKQSPKGYRLLKKLFTYLPSVRTLNRETRKVKFDCGLNDALMEVLKQKTIQFNDIDKICSLVFDEMSLTPHIEYDAGNDKIVGFVDEVVNKRKCKYADHALVFIVRGVVGSWRQPLAYYFVEGTVNAMTLAAIIKKTVAAVVECGLDPLVLICDQGPTNRTALKHLQTDTKRQQILNDEAVDGTINLFGKTLHVVYDPPHLLKGIRNNFLTKDIVSDGKVATWKDIVELYNLDNEIGEVRMLPKLTEDCINEQKMKKMKVANCCRVLSESVYKALFWQWKYEKKRFGEVVDDSKKNTAEVILFFDQLFDSVNCSKGNSTVGKMRVPVTDKSNHIQFWITAIQKLEKMTFNDSCSAKAKNSHRTLSVKVPSLTNWIVTLKSFCAIWEKLQKKGVKLFYTRHLNQDPLENLFGKIRSMNYRNINPDCYTFGIAFKNTVINNLAGLHSTSANCEEDLGKTIVSLEELFGHSKAKKIVAEIEENTYSKNESEILKNADYPLAGCSNIVSSAVKERLAVQSTAYVAGFICKKIIKNNNCKRCKKTYMATEEEQIHEWIASKEYVLLKGKYLTYPSPRIVLLLKKCIEFIRLQLGSCPQRNALKKYIVTEFLKLEDVSWLGCNEHKKKTITIFMNLTFKLEVYNWCTYINKVLKGNCIRKKDEALYAAEKLASEKFIQQRRKRPSNYDVNDVLTKKWRC